MANRLTTVESIIEAIGEHRLMALTGRKKTHVCNWKNAGNFPAEFFLLMNDELAKLGFTAPPKLWRQALKGGRAA